MTEHEDLQNSVAALLLGGVDPEEAFEVRTHLESCSTCRELAARLQRIVGFLPLSAEEARPPARLRDSILAAAGASSPMPVTRAAAPSRTILHLPLRGRRPSWQQLRMPPSAVAAVLLVAILSLGAWNVSLTRQLDEQRHAAPAVATYSLTGSGSMAAASAQILAVKQQNTMIVSFRNLPAVQPGKVYELWLGDRSGKMVPGAVFVPDSDGTKVLVVSQGDKRYVEMAVTVERGPNGEQAPTQPPQMAGSLA